MRKYVAFLVFAVSPYCWGDTFHLSISPDLQVIAEESPLRGAVLKTCSQSGPPCLLDGLIAVGSLRPPRTFLTVTIRYQKRLYKLDTSGMFDPLLSPNGLTSVFGGFCYDQFNCTLRGVFGDAGTSYAAEWRIEDGHAWRSVLTDSDDVVRFFLSNLVAPKFN